MIKDTVIGLAGWGQTFLRSLSNSTVIRPVLGVDPQAPYPVDLNEMLLNVRSLEAIHRSIKSGVVEAI